MFHIQWFYSSTSKPDTGSSTKLNDLSTSNIPTNVVREPLKFVTNGRNHADTKEDQVNLNSEVNTECPVYSRQASKIPCKEINLFQ